MFSYKTQPWQGVKGTAFVAKIWSVRSQQITTRFMALCVCVCVYPHAQSCLTLCNPMNCGPPSLFVHEIFQARILDWVAIAPSKEFFRPRD